MGAIRAGKILADRFIIIVHGTLSKHRTFKLNRDAALTDGVPKSTRRSCLNLILMSRVAILTARFYLPIHSRYFLKTDQKF